MQPTVSSLVLVLTGRQPLPLIGNTVRHSSSLHLEQGTNSKRRAEPAFSEISSNALRNALLSFDSSLLHSSLIGTTHFQHPLYDAVGSVAVNLWALLVFEPQPLRHLIVCQALKVWVVTQVDVFQGRQACPT